MRIGPLSIIAGGLTIVILASQGCGSEITGTSASPSDTTIDTRVGDTDPTTGDTDSVSPDTADTSTTDAPEVITPESMWDSLSLGDDGRLDDVYVLATDVAYAAGGNRVLRWNGETWATFGEPTGDAIYGVWADDTIVIAVGAGGAIATRATGETTWTTVSSGVDNDLHGIDGRDADDVWVVGDNGIILHRTAAGWATDGEVTTHLRDVFVSPETTGRDGVLAVGLGGQLARYNGTWRQEQIARGSAALSGVLAVDDWEFAVGTEATISLLTPTAANWQGQATNDTRDRDLFAIAGAAKDDVYAFGAGGVVIHFDGVRWTVVNVAGPFNVTADLVAASYRSTPDGAVFIAVGARGDGLIRQGDRWVDLYTEPESGIRDIAGPDADHLWAVGRGGLMLTRGAQGWTALPLDTRADLNAVAVADDGVVWAVGAEGTVIRYDDGNTTYPDALVPLELFDVVAEGGEVWACGKGGTLLSITPDGRSVTLKASGAAADLRAIAVGGDGALWLGGAFGTLRRLVAGTPQTVNAGVGGSINDLVATADGVLGVGDGGIILRATATTSEIEHEAPGLFLYGIALGSGGDAFAVGWNGTILRDTADGWTREVSGVNGILEAVWTDGDEALATGRQGTLLKRKEGL